MKRCNKCGEVKPLDDFYDSKGGRDGKRPECKPCNLAARRRWYQANREKVIARAPKWQRENPERYTATQRAYQRDADKDREYHLKKQFGLTQAEYERRLEEQGGGCAVCGNPPGKTSLHVDHDHDTGGNTRPALHAVQQRARALSGATAASRKWHALRGRRPCARDGSA